jgi:hypothetical protein
VLGPCLAIYELFHLGLRLPCEKIKNIGGRLMQHCRIFALMPIVDLIMANGSKCCPFQE